MRAWGQLPGTITKKLEDHHDMNGMGPVEWRHLVAYATRQLTKRDAEPSAALACTTSAASAAPAQPTPAARASTIARNLPAARAPVGRNTAPPPPPPRAKQAHVAEHNATTGKYTCWICQDLQAFDPTSHTADRCFANPQSPFFRPEVRASRLAALKRVGGTPSERYLALGEPPAGQLAGNYATYEALHAEFASMPLSNEVKDALVEELLNDDQRRAQEDPLPDVHLQQHVGNFVGMYTHVDDGILGDLRYTPPTGGDTCGGAAADAISTGTIAGE